MDYLHNEKERFEQAINIASYQTGLLAQAIEKDYYVTMILRLLSNKVPFLVFKGGTSLSKCHGVINRFSEDIDITIDASISRGQKKRLKGAIKETITELGLIIPNIDETRSGRNYNRYEIEYDTVLLSVDESLSLKVLLEVSFTAFSFPTVVMPVTNYIGKMMETEAPEVIEKYNLGSFEMKVQGIDRTLVDKVFAICDYYLDDKVEKHSRHLYDIYRLLPIVPQNDAFKQLITSVREIRKPYQVCPSAQDDVDVSRLLEKIIQEKAYKRDYDELTMKLIAETKPVSYEVAITAIERIAKSHIFGN